MGPYEPVKAVCFTKVVGTSSEAVRQNYSVALESLSRTDQGWCFSGRPGGVAMRTPQQKFAAGLASVGVVLVIAAAIQAYSPGGDVSEVTDETVWVEPTGQPLLPPEDPPPVTTTTSGRQRSTAETSQASTTTVAMMHCTAGAPYRDYVYILFDGGGPLGEEAVSMLGVTISRFGVSTEQEVLDLGFDRAMTIAEQYTPPLCGGEDGVVPVPEPPPYVSTTHAPYGATSSTSSTSSTSTSSTVPSSTSST